MRLSRFSAHLCLLAFFICIFAPATDAAKLQQPLELTAIRFTAVNNNTRITLTFNQKPDYRAFILGNPYRLILDVPTVRWKTGKMGMSGVSLLKGYRSGQLDQSLTRIVFDMRKPAIIAAVNALPKTGMTKDRIVIDLAPSSVNMFSAKENVVFGDARIRSAGDAPALSASETAAAAAESVQDDKPVVKQVMKAQLKGEKKYTVVLDAGHGGEDPGAIAASGIREKNITLAVVKEIGRQLEETGKYKVVYTRSTDVYIKLRDRVDISRKVGGDLFVSIHADKVSRPDTRGASIYTLSRDASDTETAKLASDENNSGVVAGVDLSEESHDVAGILLDLAMREKMNDSSVLARYLEMSFHHNSVLLLPNSHRSAGFAVLKAPDVPSVLIETGFLSNPNEAKLLTSAPFQSKIATSVVGGVDAYFKKLQSLQKP